MNLQAFSVGVVFIVGAVVLLLIEKTTPKNELVPAKPWVYYSHWSVQMSIILMVVMGVVLIMLGMVL